jgi:hypothetical protein
LAWLWTSVFHLGETCRGLSSTCAPPVRACSCLTGPMVSW